MDLVPIKVTIGLRPNGHAAYPEFNNLVPAADRDEMDWSHYVDKFGGWQYDKLAGHKEDDPAAGSPLGVQHGVLLVPKAFAVAALASPDVSELAEAELVTFYNTRAHAHEPDVAADQSALEEIKNLRDRADTVPEKPLTVEELQRIAKAYDPDDPEPGLKRNPNKNITRFKAKMGVTIVRSRG